MSGIAGIIHFDNAPVESGLIEAMTSAMGHRGPDGIRHWTRGSAALGQCMLCTTAESLEETQPLANEDQSLVLVMDGRLDNWQELRNDLLAKGAVLRDRSDAELVLRAYEIWRNDCVLKLDGDFAFVIWDARKQVALCARDRMGNKPLHYHWSGRTLAFATDLKPLLALPWVAATPNEGMLAEFLSDEWYSRDETLWGGILRLIAAHRMTVDRRGARPEEYWAPDLSAQLPYRSDAEYVEHYRELLFDCVRRAARSHKSVAIEVSGGLDSSAVLGVAEHLRRAGRLPAPALEGYTLAFSDFEEANEVEYARAVADHLDIRIHEVVPERMPLSWFAERAETLRDFPGYPNGTSHRSICRLASARNQVVILTGAWGDHWLQGSRVYYAEELAGRRWRNLRDCLAADVRSHGAMKATGWLLRHGIYPLFPPGLRSFLRPMLHGWRRQATRDGFWLSPPLKQALARQRAKPQPDREQHLRAAGQRDLLRALYYAFDHHGAEVGDRLGADSAVEIRHPFRNWRMVQFALSTPERLRLRGDVNKFVHVEAMRDILPDVVRNRKDKAGFACVFAAYLEHMGPYFVEYLPLARSAWCSKAGMSTLFSLYRDRPELGWQNWVLWNFYGCDKVFVD